MISGVPVSSFRSSLRAMGMQPEPFVFEPAEEYGKSLGIVLELSYEYTACRIPATLQDSRYQSSNEVAVSSPLDSSSITVLILQQIRDPTVASRGQIPL